MRRLATLILLTFTLAVTAQPNKFSLSAGVFVGIPTMNSKIKNDNFYLKNISFSDGLSLGIRYDIFENWQLGFMVSATGLTISKNKSEQSIVQNYALPNQLSRASGGGDISLVGLSLDVKRLFKYKGWTFAPFIRPNTFYTLDISKRFSIYAKNPNEHYYQTTEWNNNSDTSLAIRFSPIKLSMGVQCSHRLKGRFFAYSSIQYVSGDIHLGFLKSQQDFYDVKSIEQVDYRQRFRYLGFDFGVYWYFQ